MSEPKSQRDFRNKAERILDKLGPVGELYKQKLINSIASELFHAYQDGIAAQITGKV